MASPKHMVIVFFILLAYLSFITMQASASLLNINPPDGNAIFLSFVGKGVQIYQCLLQPDGSSFRYVYHSVEAALFQSAQDHPSQVQGFLYFLPYPDAEGGQPTFSLLDISQNVSLIPTSTATFKVIAETNSSDDSANNSTSLLFQATSHSGKGPLSMASYAQLINSSVVPPPSTSCSRDAAGSFAQVPYMAQYLVWTLANIPPSTTPPDITVPQTASQTPLIYFFGQGYQIYTFNGTSWAQSNVSADLSALPGNPIIGKHYYLPQKDANGGLATWALFVPPGRLTAIPSRRVQMDPNNIPWMLANATSHAGDSCILSNVVYVQRLSTVGGIPPASIDGANLGDVYQSQYTAIYSFYTY